MERTEALRRLRNLQGRDLVEMAHTFGVTVWKDGKLNKGWAGHVVERYLGLELNSSRSPDFDTWELKVVPLALAPDGSVGVKETMAIAMINPQDVAMSPFEQSHLLRKLRRLVICARLFESRGEHRSEFVRAVSFDLLKPELIEQIRQDYLDVQEVIRLHGASFLTGRMGVLIQPRTKGPGHGSTSRAFYARKSLVRTALGL